MEMTNSMERIDSILKHDLFLKNLEQNHSAEANRRFCRHNMVHFLDVARIGWILNLEEGLGLQKELVYAVALLHDIGKHVQYQEGTPHEVASGEIAPVILKECGFEQEEITEIVEAILSHRDSAVKEEASLRGILYRADKASRACFICEANAECNWKDEKKNLRIKW